LKNRLPLEIDVQIKGMLASWPLFKVHNVDRIRQTVRWRGVFEPQYTRYTIEVRYKLTASPEVRILDPVLVRLPNNSEGQLPHVYPPADDPTLCLYDPKTHQWDKTMLIADKIVPWAFDWIVCYELWLITGTWSGGGRHAGNPRSTQETS
jgi:hypothetical protein